jgi:hypothetical protein
VARLNGFAFKPGLYAQFAVQLSDLKKTLASPQNLENKRPGFFLPSRSMVLKVVRAKILETLGLGVVFCAVSELRGELENHTNAFSFHHVAELSAGRNRSAAFSACTNEKTLDTAQNLENKQPGIFLPARSMVLKVVRGKILETLGLSCLSAACGSVSEHRGNGLRRVDCEVKWHPL